MINPFAIDAYANTTAETCFVFEIMMRLSSCSNDIDYNNLTFTVFTEHRTYIGAYNSSKNGINYTFSNVVTQSDYCIEFKFGNTNIVLEDDELVILRWRFNSTNVLHTNKDFAISFIPAEGAYVNLELETPKVLNRQLTHIRI